MADRLHRVFTTEDGIHYVQAWWAVDEAARLALEPDAVADIGKVCRQGGGDGSDSFWIYCGDLETEGEGGLEYSPVWRRLDNTSDGAGPSDATPADLYAQGDVDGQPVGDPFAGVAAEYARADHVHLIATGEPVDVGSTNEEGSSVYFARADHVHAIGPALEATLSGDDPQQIVAYTDVVDEEGTTYGGVASAGGSAQPARADHAHAILTAPPLPLTPGMTNEEGTSAALARADHAHDTTALGGGGASTVTPLTFAGTALTLDATHTGGQHLLTTAATPVTITIPLDFADMPIGSSVSGCQRGAGRVGFAKGDVAVNLYCAMQLFTRTQYSTWNLLKTAANDYELTGDLLL